MTVSGPRFLRVFAAVLMAAAGFKVWHLLLLRQDLDHPGVVAAWMLMLLLAWIAAVRPSRSTLLAGCSFFILLFVFHWGYERAASDGREYFVQVRSLVFDRDLDFTNENATFGVRGTARIYPFGAALLWAPFMVAAHIWLKLLNLFGGAYATDGYSNPYQMAIGLGTLVYGFVGLVLIWRMLRDYFGERIAAIATIAITAGSFFFWYLTVENSMVHGASMFATTLVIYIWYRGRPDRADAGGRQARGIGWWLALGLAGALMTMVRWQNVTFFVLAVFITLFELRRVDRPVIRGVAACAIGFVIGFLPQLIFWKVVRGGWFALPTADHSFNIRAYHAWDVLFSANHGLLATTPLIYLAILGVPLFIRRDRPLAILLITGFLSQVIVNAGPEGWWGGSGYGARRFDNSLMMFAVGLASLLVWLRHRPLVAPIAAISALIAGNFFVMADVRSLQLPSGEAITFTDAMTSVSKRLGNVVSFPYNLYVAWRFDTDALFYDRLRGHSYNNVEIDFGGEGDEAFLGHGWSYPERRDSTTFRWSSGPVSSVIVPLRSGDRYRVEITCEPFTFPNAPNQVLTIEVNRRVAASMVLRPGVQTFAIDLPAGTFHPNLNLIQFRYGRVTSPAQAGVSGDPRPLGVLFNHLKLRRLLDDAP